MYLLCVDCNSFLYVVYCLFGYVGWFAYVCWFA